MIYTVTVNPALDYFMELDKAVLGVTNRVQKTRKLPGGKGIIESRMMARLGTTNTALGFIGGYSGDFIENFLVNEGVQVNFTRIQDESRINTKIKTLTDETEFNAAGPQLSLDEIRDFIQHIENLQAGDIVVFAGIPTANLGENFYARMIEIAKSCGAEFVIDAEGQAVLDVLSEHPIVVKPNKIELEEMFSVKFDKIEDILPYGRKMLAMGAQNVMVSMAGEGALLFCDDKTYFAPPAKGEIKNSVGAGDSMVAGFLSEWLKTHNALLAFHQAVACGTAKVFSEDMPNAEFLEKCYQDTSFKEI